MDQPRPRLLVWLVPGSVSYSADGFSGSLWDGQAFNVHVENQGVIVALGDIDWQLSPWSLLVLSPAIELEADYGEQQLALSAQYFLSGDIAVDTLRLRLMVSSLSYWLPVDIGGTLQLSASDLELHGQQVIRGQGILSWNNASWSTSSGAIPLGSYQGDFVASEEQGLHLSVDEPEQPVAASGWARLRGESYGVDVTISSNNQAVRNALKFIAEETAEGLRVYIPIPEQ